jgi:hypothetical protein
VLVGATAAVIDCMRRCLDRDQTTRATIPDLLEHDFLRPCRALSAALRGAAVATSGAASFNEITH